MPGSCNNEKVNISRSFAVMTATVAIAFIACFKPVFAQQQVDEIVTGSVRAELSTQPPAKGSLTFRRALEAIGNGDYIDAYSTARRLQNTVERRTIQWAAIYFGQGRIDYETVLRFQKDAPHFASSKTYKTRLEQALTKSSADADSIIRLLGGKMPNTLEAQIALANAYRSNGQSERALRIIREVWTTNFLSRTMEANIMRRYGDQLTRADHWARTVRLLMHDRAKGAERIVSKLSSDQKTLVEARIAVSRQQGNAGYLLHRVAHAYRDHPLFHFAHAQYLADQNSFVTAAQELDRARGDLPEAHLWWLERRKLARQLLRHNKHAAAYKVVAAYDTGPEGSMVDASFHAGWIALSFLNDALIARQHFVDMQDMATLPETISKAHYWLGRTYAATNQPDEARGHFQQAARFNQYYHGQLAMVRLGEQTISLRRLPEWRKNQSVFAQRELVQAIRLFESNRVYRFARPLLRRLIYQVREPGDMLLTARLAQDVEAHDLAILMSDVANRRGVGLDLFAFPKDGLPRTRLASVDNAAVYAVARQESNFNAAAISRSGARGLMQLMPGTARETAGKLGLRYSASKLTSDPVYNALLGSTYLLSRLERFNGSLVLAAAAYNAGAGNVDKWIRTYGDPRHLHVDPVVWIELIPFAETRRYVQKVLANYQIYKLRLGDNRLDMARYLRTIYP